MSNDMFKRGYQTFDNEKKRQEEESKKRQGRIYKFYLSGDGDEADLQFLTEEPINVNTHNVMSYRNGKETFDDVLCTKGNCKHCQDGDRAQFKSAYLIIDKREVKVADKDNPKKKRTIKDQIRLFMYGTKVTSQCARISKKYGLTGRICTLVKLGKGQQASYTLEKGDANKLTSKQIKALLPEALQDQYDGTEDSLYAILEDQLMKLMPSDADSDEDEEEAEVENKRSRSRIISTDDSDDDEDEDEDEIDFEDMTDKELIKYATEAGITPKTVGIGAKKKLKDRDALIEELQELQDSDDDDEEDDDDGEKTYTQEELEEMDDDELIEVSEGLDLEPVYKGVGRKKRLNREETMWSILEEAGSEEDDDDEDEEDDTPVRNKKTDTRTLFKRKK